MMEGEESSLFAEESVAVKSLQSSHAEESVNMDASPKRKRVDRKTSKKRKKPKTKWYSSKINLLILAGIIAAVIGISVKVSSSVKRKKNQSSSWSIDGNVESSSGNSGFSTSGNSDTSNSIGNGNNANDGQELDFVPPEEETFEIVPGVNSGGSGDNPFGSETENDLAMNENNSTNGETDLSTDAPTAAVTTINQNTDTDTSVVSTSSVNINTFTDKDQSETITTTAPTPSPTEFVAPAPTKCWSWRLAGEEINGKNPEEQSGGSVSLSFNGRHVAVGGIDHVRTFISEDRRSMWEMTQEANSNFPEITVALSGDGKRLLIGSSLTDNNNNAEGVNGDGEVRVFQYSETVQWFPLGQTLYGNEFDKMFGNSIDITYTGSRIIVGSEASVRVFQLKQETTSNGLAARWETIRHIIKIIPDEIFGSSVAISASGNRIAVGEPVTDSDRRGAVSVFNLDPYALILKVEGNRYEDRLGKSVALSADGNRVVAGAYWGDYVQAYEWLADKAAWSLMGFRIYGEDSDSFGRQVDMSSDGRRIAISAPKDSTGGEFRGTTRVYEFVDGDWQQLGMDIYGQDEYDYAGWSMSLSGDGRSIAIGADFNSMGGYKTGQVRVFEYYCDQS